MARIRTIKPEFFSHEVLASKSPHARLLAIGLLTLADCEGRLRWVPMQVHSQVFPWEAEVRIQVLLGELLDASYVRHYEVDGKQYVEIVNFRKHQRLSGKELEYKSRCPPPPDESQKPNDLLGENGEANGKHPGTSQVLPREAAGIPKEHRNIGTEEHRNIRLNVDGASTMSVQQFFDLWNSQSKQRGLSFCRVLGKDRQAKIAVRLRQPEWLVIATEAMARLPLPGDGWQPTLDWLVENESNAARIVEGKFDFRATLNASKKSQMKEKIPK